MVDLEIAETLENPEDWFNAEEIPTVSLSGKMGITIASYLVEFMVMRGVIGVVLGKSEKRVNKAGDEFVLKSQSFIEPKLDIESMPHASKLPMVCVPVGWGRQEVEGTLPTLN